MQSLHRLRLATSDGGGLQRARRGEAIGVLNVFIHADEDNVLSQAPQCLSSGHASGRGVDT